MGIEFELPSILYFYKFCNAAYAHPKNEYLVEDLTQLGMTVIIDTGIDLESVYLTDNEGKITMLVVG